MSMFTNYELVPDSYIPNNAVEPNSTPTNPKAPLVEYDGRGRMIGYTWSYGDTVYLEFNTTGNVIWDERDGANGVYEDAETYLHGKYFKIMMLDFRYQVIAKAVVPAAANVRVLSDSFYPEALVKGVYKLRMDIVDKEGKTLNTLIDGDDCIIYIK